ncbi:hypothetical protein NP493_823g01021 [Ridgeia piscesae]|uniref:Uncharacterized protein n=1 Tax=Ridgeia piscesae TaxID=27915 RepID=A0AAD9KML5_RIDPI|nr:hypothetical protein NP493_823g01021 [Ridgeia piscesae]
MCTIHITNHKTYNPSRNGTSKKATNADLENSTQAINTQLQTLQQEIKKLTHPQVQTTGTHPTMTAPISQDLASVVKEEITEREQIMAENSI